jgi:hypothetical protein
MRGVIKVGNGMETGNNMNMLIGGIGVLPFNASTPSNFVVSFVPKNIKIPPTVSMTYNVTVSNSTSKLYSHSYDTLSGILDLELMPLASTNSTITSLPIQEQFTTWGPDFVSQEGHGSTGTFHIQGPMLTNNTQYYLTVQIVSKDGVVFKPPVSDQFILPTQMPSSSLSNETSAASNSSSASGNSTSSPYSIIPNPAPVPSKAPAQMPTGNFTYTPPGG